MLLNMKYFPLLIILLGIKCAVASDEAASAKSPNTVDSVILIGTAISGCVNVAVVGGGSTQIAPSKPTRPGTPIPKYESMFARFSDELREFLENVSTEQVPGNSAQHAIRYVDFGSDSDFESETEMGVASHKELVP